MMYKGSDRMKRIPDYYQYAIARRGGDRQNLSHVIRIDNGTNEPPDLSAYHCSCDSKEPEVVDTWKSLVDYIIFLSDVEICILTETFDMFDTFTDSKIRSSCRYVSMACGQDVESLTRSTIDEHEIVGNQLTGERPKNKNEYPLSYLKVVDFLTSTGVGEKTCLNSFDSKLLAHNHYRPHALDFAKATQHVVSLLLDKIAEKLSKKGENFLVMIEIERLLLLRSNMVKIYAEIVEQHRKMNIHRHT